MTVITRTLLWSRGEETSKTANVASPRALPGTVPAVNVLFPERRKWSRNESAFPLAIPIKTVALDHCTWSIRRNCCGELKYTICQLSPRQRQSSKQGRWRSIDETRITCNRLISLLVLHHEIGRVVEHLLCQLGGKTARQLKKIYIFNMPWCFLNSTSSLLH